jgi:hypothetical protein
MAFQTRLAGSRGREIAQYDLPAAALVVARSGSPRFAGGAPEGSDGGRQSRGISRALRFRKHLKDLELENSRLRKEVSDLTLDLILRKTARGNF